MIHLQYLNTVYTSDLLQHYLDFLQTFLSSDSPKIPESTEKTSNPAMLHEQKLIQNTVQ